MKPILGVISLIALFVGCSNGPSKELDQRSPSQSQSTAALAAINCFDGSVPDPGVETTTDASVDPQDADTTDADTPVEVDAGPPPPPCNGPPGLYIEGSCEITQPGIRLYVPEYELWSDGAAKERFIYIPAGTRIDTVNPDRWSFPQGTRLYKTFSQGGKRLETRLIEKTGAETGFENWTFVAYQWSEDQLSVTPASAEGVQNVLGTQHDIPSQMQCGSCHRQGGGMNGPGLDAVNGFGALLLNHIGAGLSLAELIQDDWLQNSSDGPLPRTEDAHFPGDAEAQNALGYLHSNCGHCHGGPSPRAGLQLWTTYATLEIADAPALRTASCECLTRWTGRMSDNGEEYTRRVVLGHSSLSGILGRMKARGPGEQMPPLGTEYRDENAINMISQWLDKQDMGSCDPTVACPPPPAPMMMGGGSMPRP
jgi:mono/diheme cytochrome c family protein